MPESSRSSSPAVAAVVAPVHAEAATAHSLAAAAPAAAATAAAGARRSSASGKRLRSAAGPSQAALSAPVPTSSRKRKAESGDARAEVDLTGLSSEASGMARAIDARYKSDAKADRIPALALLKDLVNYVPEGDLAMKLDGIKRVGSQTRDLLSEAFGAINKRNSNAIMDLGKDEDNKTWYAYGLRSK